MEVYCLFMMRKKEKVITMTVTLILAVILICIKVTHFVIIERPLKQCRIVSAYHLTVDTNGAQIDQSWLFEKDDLTYRIIDWQRNKIFATTMLRLHERNQN